MNDTESKPDTVVTETTFHSLGLADSLIHALDDAGFHHCTPIQEKTLPIALDGLDVAGQAQTGTGKTAAFLLAAMDRLIRDPGHPKRRKHQPRALIVAPTRELAVQIHSDAELFNRFAKLKLALAYGGEGYDVQKDTIAAGCDILIGTPGRIIDYLKQNLFDFKSVEVVVIDEADRLFDLGFIKDIRFLLRRCPPPEKRLGLLFSATLSWRVLELAYEHMNDPETVKIETEQITADRVRQVVYHTANDEKTPLLIGLLRAMPDATRIMVFVNTKRAADDVCGYLKGNGFEAEVLSGDVPQKRRMRLLKSFADGELPVLVATDVAARGLHIPDVSHVFNYDLPHDAQDYVHRIGRTARFGTEGDAISFACEGYAYSLPEIEAYIGIKIPLEPVQEAQLATLNPPVKVRSRATEDQPGPGNKRHQHHERHPNNNSGGGSNRRSPVGRHRRRRYDRSDTDGPAPGNEKRPEQHHQPPDDNVGNRAPGTARPAHGGGDNSAAPKRRRRRRPLSKTPG